MSRYQKFIISVLFIVFWVVFLQALILLFDAPPEVFSNSIAATDTIMETQIATTPTGAE